MAKLEKEACFISIKTYKDLIYFVLSTEFPFPQRVNSIGRHQILGKSK
jgi:hypothetical protein